ncbi:MAG: hypothetical protein R3302_09750 [Sulfurimonadaceae bacterium]|nr:hypothetical protein [Sulfurimonadaceae bacterium]
MQVGTALNRLQQLPTNISQSSQAVTSKAEPFSLQTQQSTNPAAAAEQKEITPTVQSVPKETVQTTFASMIEFLSVYQQTASQLRREEGINSYVDNSGSFKDIGKRASTPVATQLDTNYALSLRYIGQASGGIIESDRGYSDPKMLAQTTQAITAYNLAAQSAKEAQNHATYLQNSMNGLNYVHYAS